MTCVLMCFDVFWCVLCFFCVSLDASVLTQTTGQGFECFRPVVSRMRSKGSRFTLGVWGLRVCSLDVAFVVATVRNRSQPFARTPYGRAYGKFCRGGSFWRFQTSGCFVSRGRRGTS